MGDSFFMRLYTKEYLSDSKVRTLSREHRADLVDLWCHCDQEGSIPMDPLAIGRLLGLAPAVARRTMEALRPFFQEEDGRLYSPRHRKERQARDAESLKKRGAAQKTNAKRWGFPSPSESDTASLSDTVSESLSESLSDTVSESLSVSLKGRQSVVRYKRSTTSPSLRSGEGRRDRRSALTSPPPRGAFDSDPSLRGQRPEGLACHAITGRAVGGRLPGCAGPSRAP